jgi:predicted nucleotidyltransferase
MGPLDPARELLESQPPVRLAYVFGSTARGEAGTSSDVDIGVVLDATMPPVDLADLAEKLEGVLSRRVDLLAIEQAVSRLRTWRPVTAERLEGDLLLQWAVERGLQVAAEALFDLGGHVLAGEFQESVDRYADIPPRLVARGVLRSETSERLRGASENRKIRRPRFQI